MNFFLPSTPRRRSHGAALVIILAFIALLTGLIVAYFTRAMFSRQTANMSAGQTKANLLAQAATDQIITDFKQEIVQGSTATVAGTAPNQVTIYTPADPAPAGNPSATSPINNKYMVPQRNGIPTGTTDLMPNLVRRSFSPDAGFVAVTAPAVSSRASKVNSFTNPSVDGRTVSPTRWNSHYLLPRFDKGTTVDSTPDTGANFVAPDWVLMTRSGPKVKTVADLLPGANAITNSVSTNQEYVTGRYAYAVYDEGGLLDVNVAGYPPPGTTTLAETGYTPTQAARKGVTTLADLTQLPIVKSPAVSRNPSEYLTQEQVNKIVGWRNYASSNGPQGTFPNFTFSPDNATSWFANFGLGSTTGFLQVSNKSVNGKTDQSLLSRQQLLKLRGAMGFDQNVLQYLTTYSRSLDQPSISPDPTRPKIIGTTTPPDAFHARNYTGNNDAVGGDDQINPKFLSIRVAAAFTRQDGSTAVVGEPLVKRRFALSRLAQVTYSATAPKQAGNKIYDQFGLSRSSVSSPWTYDHGSGGSIMTLSKVADANREPDFAELLKAAINVGSLGKGGPNLNEDNGYMNYQYTLDTSVDYQVIQIMASLIDQYDSDSYPTVIQMTAGAVTRTFAGVEDLPYFYRYHEFTIVTKAPNPLSARTDRVNFYKSTDLVFGPDGKPIGLKPGATVAFGNVPWCQPVASTTTTQDFGEAAMVYVPEVWNPHDVNTALNPDQGVRPARFRLVAYTADPTGQTAWKINLTVKRDSAITPVALMSSTNIQASPFVALNETNTALTFGDDQGKLFREPTLLWRADAPTNANLTSLAPLSGPHPDVVTGVSWYGSPVGKAAVAFTAKPDGYWGNYKGTFYPDGTTYMFQYQSANFGQQVAPGAPSPQITYRLQYEYPPNSNQWLTYDEKYPDFHGLYDPSLVVNPADFLQNTDAAYPYAYKNLMPGYLNHGSDRLRDNATAYDPRTARFGIGTASTLNDGGIVPLLEPLPVQYFNNASKDSTSADQFLGSRFTIMATQRPTGTRGLRVFYSNPGMTQDPGHNLQIRFFSGVGWSATNGQNQSPNLWDGLLSQNNPAVFTTARDNSTQAQIYYEDADGVARRAMGAYAETAISNGNPSTIGMPLATATTYTGNGPASGLYGVGKPTAQTQSRPIILNRPFRTVAEMSYAYRGGPWKQVDFFTPESGDAGLLDVFCIDEPPTNALVAGKVNLNTRQAPVLQALLAGSYRDEQATHVSTSPPPNYPLLSALTPDEASTIASKLVLITTDATRGWRGPLVNVGDVVGHYAPNPGTPTNEHDLYTYKPPSSANGHDSVTYGGLSGWLDNTKADAALTKDGSVLESSYKIQRMREAAIRPLTSSGQTRVWNLLIDVVAQSGRYASGAKDLSRFAVDGEKRYWVHVAIDRFTGEVIDKKVEMVTE